MTTGYDSGFISSGLMGPLDLFSQEQATHLLRAIQREIEIPRSQKQFWYKSLHQISETVMSLARENAVLATVKEHLGDNILLWGSQLIQQGEGIGHRWHRDVEHEKWPGLTIWIALNNFSTKTTISFITKSHLINVSPQHFLNEGLNLNDSQEVLKTARKIDGKCELITFVLKEGQFMLWDGPMWHATANYSADVRSALILQLCSSSAVPLLPKNFDIPFQFYDVAAPSALVHGVNLNVKNWIINPISPEAN